MSANVSCIQTKLGTQRHFVCQISRQSDNAYAFYGNFVSVQMKQVGKTKNEANNFEDMSQKCLEQIWYGDY